MASKLTSTKLRATRTLTTCTGLFLTVSTLPHAAPAASAAMSAGACLLDAFTRTSAYDLTSASALPRCMDVTVCAGAALQLPLWLAPNLITLMGTMALVASYLTSAYYTPDFEGEAATAAAEGAQAHDDIRRVCSAGPGLATTISWAARITSQRAEHASVACMHRACLKS
jgi:hypothetical protein